MAAGKKTLYQILGIQRDANPLDIGLGYEKRMAQMQRMVPPDPSAAALVQQAYEILSNPARREAYDAQLVTAAEKKAAAEQAAPDFEIGEEEAPKKKVPVAAIAAGVVVLAVILVFALRSGDSPKPAPQPVAEKAAPPPPPPPPPRARSAAEVLAEVARAGGALSSYTMSGTTQAIGVAIATEPGTMLTTCHGIPAGGKLVVRVGKEQLPADLTITDEELDLCRLSVTGLGAPPLRIAADEPRAGDKVITIGLDAKGALAAAEGTVKGVRKGPAGNVLEITTPVSQSSSGAGVFDAYGRLVGIATAPHGYGAGAHVALPATWISQMRSRTTPTK